MTKPIKRWRVSYTLNAKDFTEEWDTEDQAKRRGLIIADLYTITVRLSEKPKSFWLFRYNIE